MQGEFVGRRAATSRTVTRRMGNPFCTLVVGAGAVDAVSRSVRVWARRPVGFVGREPPAAAPTRPALIWPRLAPVRSWLAPVRS